MEKETKIALIGLDTSHAIEFSRIMQAPDYKESQRIKGLRAVSCLSFLTPFISREELNERAEQLRSWGVNVTESFEEAIDGCDAVMLEINDPFYHLEYFQKCVNLKKPIFLDKPLADTIQNGKKISDLIGKYNLKVFSASSLRFRPQLLDACQKINNPFSASIYGCLGKAPAGSSIVWYGVHTFEMLERIMGRGAKSVSTQKSASGLVCIVTYPEEKYGIVELSTNIFSYGGCLRREGDSAHFTIDMSTAYADLLREVNRFFETGITPVQFDDTLEVMALLDAAERSFQSGSVERVSVVASNH